MQFQGHPKKYESVLLNRPVCLPHQAAKISANEKNSKIPQEIPCRIRAAIRMCVISIVISLPHFKLKIPKNKNQAVCVKTQHLLDLSASLFSSRSNPPPHHAHTASSTASRSHSVFRRFKNLVMPSSALLSGLCILPPSQIQARQPPCSSSW